MVSHLTIERCIAIAVYPGVSLLDLGGPLEAFRVASEFGGCSRQKDELPVPRTLVAWGTRAHGRWCASDR
jgi:hypothetical protein